ncbi:MAG: phosphodiester glycosidase family protein, partial [Microcystaceae cyanobacterium]
SLLGLLLSPFIFYGWRCFLRPLRTDMEQNLYRGITYKRYALSTPRPAMIHIVTIDLKTPGVKAFVTPGFPKPSDRETSARKTSDFLKEFKLQLAINASYFHHFHEKSPWEYYPHSGDPSYPIGEAISNGYRYSSPEANFPVLCFSAQNRVQILKNEKCPEGTAQGVAGSQLLVYDGKAIDNNLKDDKPYPRVAAAINREGTKLWLIAVDGKQPLYSEGITIAELTKIVTDLGAHTALNLDGGGSTTLVMGSNNGSKVLNAPIHTRVPMRERPVGNHLGFYALE